MARMNGSRCPKCHAKLKRDVWFISCRRCGYSQSLPMDRFTEHFLFG